MAVVYVSPTGRDLDEGTAQFPFRTVTRALQRARPGGVVQLAPGAYQAGERFPLVVPAGVTIAGTTRQAVVITGGGPADNATNDNAITDNVTVVLGDRAQLREVTITNPQGSGILANEGVALVVNNRLLNCQQHGLVATQKACPFISKNEFIGNGGSGLTMRAQAKGEIRQNIFERTGEGIVIGDQAAPLVIDNQLTGNRYAIVTANFARPVLRKKSGDRQSRKSPCG